MHEGVLLTWVTSKNCCLCENKNATRARKKHLEINKFTENECLPNCELKFKLLENLRKSPTHKSMRKGFHCLPTGTAHKNRKRLVSLSDLVALAMRFRINPQTDDINSFMKCNMEISHQAVNFSITLTQWLIIWLSCALLVEAPWLHG